MTFPRETLHILLFLELETAILGIAVPWAKEWLIFFSDFLDLIFNAYFDKNRFRVFANFTPGRALHRCVLHLCVIHHWIRLKKTKKMSKKDNGKLRIEKKSVNRSILD